MMFLTRLTLIVASLMAAGTSAVAAVVLCLAAMAAGSPNPDPPKPGPDDLPGRVVDKSGAGVAGVQVWAIDGPGWTPETVAKATTDGQGRFVLPWARGCAWPARRPELRPVRPRPGRPGRLAASGLAQQRRWKGGRDRAHGGRRRPGPADRPERPADRRRRGRDRELISRSAERNSGDYHPAQPEVTALFRTTTAADGSFVLKGIPQGAGIFAAIAAPAFGSPSISWDTARPATIVLDSRLGRIKGRLRPPDARGLPNQLALGLHSSPRPDNAVPGPYRGVLQERQSGGQGRHVPVRRPAAGPIHGQRLFRSGRDHRHQAGIRDRGRPRRRRAARDPTPAAPEITGRVVDARTGKGVAGIEPYVLAAAKRGRTRI